MARTKFPTQVYRVDGKDCFLEVLCDALPIDKVSLNFVYYDKTQPAGQREQGKVKIYMEIFQAATLSGDILSGRIAGLARQSRKKAAEAGEKYPESVFSLLGGTAAKNTLDNQAVSRQFRLLPGNVKPYVAEAISGPGIEQENGLITPNGKPDVAIRVALETDKLKELAHANTLAVLSQTADKVLRLDSLVTEKIVVRLFQEVFDYTEALDVTIYERLKTIYLSYEKFPVRCYGEHVLIDTLKESRIKNPKTFAWFAERIHVVNQVFMGFDIEDTKWDTLAAELEEKAYDYLFEQNLILANDKARIQNCIDRYHSITGKDYVQSYYEGDERRQFNLLVQFGIIDLWSAFQNSLDKAGAMAKPKMMARIGSYIHGIKTEEGFRFCKRFFSQYGIEDYHTYFENSSYHSVFSDGLMSSHSYNNKSIIELKFERSYLAGRPDDLKMVLQWLQEYLFKYEVELYIPFICAVLKNAKISCLFSQGMGRKMFDLIALQPCISKSDIVELKEKYWTEAELAAEKEATKAAEEQKAKREAEMRKQEMKRRYDEIVDGSLRSVVRFIDHYQYTYDLGAASRIAAETLLDILKKKNSELDSEEICWFIKIWARLMQENVVTFSEIQQYILQIKEVTKHAERDRKNV